MRLPHSIIRCLNSYLHLKQLIFTASAAECCSWLHAAWLMMHSAELHNCFCANPALIYFGGFCFSLDSAWGRHGNHKQHIWQLFTSLMVKTTSPSHKSTLVQTIFSSNWIILRWLLAQLAPYHFSSLYFHHVQHANIYYWNLFLKQSLWNNKIFKKRILLYFLFTFSSVLI